MAPVLAYEHPDQFRAVIGINAGVLSNYEATATAREATQLGSLLDVYFHPRVGNDWKASGAFCIHGAGKPGCCATRNLLALWIRRAASFLWRHRVIRQRIQADGVSAEKRRHHPRCRVRPDRRVRPVCDQSRRYGVLNHREVSSRDHSHDRALCSLRQSREIRASSRSGAEANSLAGRNELPRTLFGSQLCSGPERRSATDPNGGLPDIP